MPMLSWVSSRSGDKLWAGTTDTEPPVSVGPNICGMCMYVVGVCVCIHVCVWGMGGWVGVWVCGCVCVILVVLVPFAPDIPGSGIYFGVYEYLLRTLTPEGKRYTCTCSQ